MFIQSINHHNVRWSILSWVRFLGNGSKGESVRLFKFGKGLAYPFAVYPKFTFLKGKGKLYHSQVEADEVTPLKKSGKGGKKASVPAKTPRKATTSKPVETVEVDVCDFDLFLIINCLSAIFYISF